MQQIDQYIKEKRLELSASIMNRKIVYLDTNYWIKLREQNKQNDSSDRQLLTKLTELVESKKCICPISEVSFWEILKQQDVQTLKETTKLVDKLSDGIAIINEDERIQLEFIHFIRSNTGYETYDLKELVWTKLAFISCANMLSVIEPISAQKSFFDFLCNVSLFEMVSLIEKNGGIKPVIFKDDIDTLNLNKLKYAEGNKSFKQMFLTELGGYLDLYQESINKAMCHLYYVDSGHSPTEEEKMSININLYKNAIYNGFKYEKITKELPVFRIVPELFASTRWDKKRIYSDGNDTLDFLHASFALPYCDFFFTERELRTMIIQRKFDSLYGCRVESNPNEVLKMLESIE